MRALGAALILAALGALAATAVLKVYFPEPKVRAMVIDAARRQLGRDVRLERIDVGLRGLTLRGLSVSESPDFAAGTFLSAGLVRVRPSWRALLRRKLVVATVAAEGLSVRVVRRAGGDFNFSSLASSAAPTAASAPPSGAAADAAEFDVRRVLVTGAEIEYRDAAAGTGWNISDLDLDVDGLGPSAPFGVVLSARVQGRAGERPIDARVRVDGGVDLARGSREGFSAEARRLVIDAEGIHLEGRAREARLDVPRVEFDAELSAAGRRLLRAAGAVTSAAALDVDAKLRTDALDAALLARLLPRSGLPPVDFPAAELDVAGSWAGSAATVRSARLTWDGGTMALAGAARALGSARPELSGSLSFAANLPKVDRGEYPFLRLPSRLALPAMRAEGQFVLTGGDLTVKTLTLNSDIGRVEAAGVVRRAFSAKPSPDVALKTGLQFSSFRAADLPFDSSLPATLAFPPLRIDGGVLLHGEDAVLQKVSFKTKAGDVVVDGPLSRALEGEWAPSLDAALDLSLPALSDADLPFPGTPAGLRLPASRWSGALSYSTHALGLRGLRARVGRNDVSVDGKVADLGGRDAFDATFKCRAFDLRELTGMTPDTRDLQLAGTGYFALSVTGTKEHPIFAGKMRFAGLGATAAGLPLSGFSGTLSADPTRVDIPNLTGKIADGTLHMDLTVKDYARAPEVQIDAHLDRFDLGRYLDAKKRLLAEHPEAAAAAAPDAAKAKSPGAGVRSRGRLEIGALTHPNAAVSQVRASWELSGVAADPRRLDGSVRLDVGGGKLRDLGAMTTQSNILKVLLFPFLVIQKIFHVIQVPQILRAFGVSLLPDFNNIDLHGMVGDYGFKNGLMTLNKSELDSSAGDVSATGTIDIPTGKLDLTVATGVKTLQIGQLSTSLLLNIEVGGTIDDMKTKVRLGK